VPAPYPQPASFVSNAIAAVGLSRLSSEQQEANLRLLEGDMNQPNDIYLIGMACFKFVYLVAIISVAVHLPLRAEGTGIRSDSRRLLVEPFGRNWEEESFKIGLRLHSMNLWHPDEESSAPVAEEPASSTLNRMVPPSHELSKCLPSDSSGQPQDHAPWHENWNNSIAICAIMRQENITDVVEWLSYYKYVPPPELPAD
jgi:hypothetical protein